MDRPARCPRCDKKKGYIYKTGEVRRYHKCGECGYTFSTVKRKY